jgi:SAM-dependent methyltransferase
VPDRADHARAVYDRLTDSYREVGLDPAERALLARLRDDWPRISMLDIGIGAGRTTYTFAAVAGRYLGIDYARAMVEACRGTFSASQRVRLRVGDARDLRSLGETFDVVLFSFNGIDTLEHEDRLAVLREVRAVLRDDGLFLFSSHSLPGLRHYLPIRSVRVRPSPWSAYRLVTEGWRSLRLLREKRRIDWGRAERDGWAMVRDGTHDFTLDVYHVAPEEQRRQLERAGLDLIEMSDAEGRRVEPGDAGPSRWLHFLCRPRPGSVR